MSSHHVNPEACHNCRRRRLKCDRTIPQCLKCKHKGQDCLGYQRLLRWQPPLASCSKRAGPTSQAVARPQSRNRDLTLQHTIYALSPNQQSQRYVSTLLLNPLTDPLMQDLDHASRGYLAYCESLPHWQSILFADKMS